jgi:hypothetical protein
MSHYRKLLPANSTNIGEFWRSSKFQADVDCLVRKVKDKMLLEPQSSPRNENGPGTQNSPGTSQAKQHAVLLLNPRSLKYKPFRASWRGVLDADEQLSLKPESSGGDGGIGGRDTETRVAVVMWGGWFGWSSGVGGFEDRRRGTEGGERSPTFPSVWMLRTHPSVRPDSTDAEIACLSADEK